MRRRQFLGLTAGLAGVAGCLDEPAGDRERNETHNESRGEGEPPLGADIVHPEPTEPVEDLEEKFSDIHDQPSVVDLETSSYTLASYPVRHLGEVMAHVRLFEKADTVSPAKLEVTILNRNDFKNTYLIEEVPPYRRKPLLYNESNDSLLLAPTENNPLVRDSRVPDVKLEEGFWRLDGGVMEWLPEAFELGAKRGVVCRYMVVAQTTHTPAPGTYTVQGRGERSLSLVLWETDSPGPTKKSRFDGVNVPDLPVAQMEEDLETQWFHEANEETAVYLQPSDEKVEPPAEIDFKLVNHSQEVLAGNPYEWSLHKLVDGEWFKIAPLSIPIPLSFMGPGRVRKSTLRLFHKKGFDGQDSSSSRTIRTADYLGGGRYAYSVGFSRGNGDPAALLDIDAPQLELTVPEDAKVEQNESTVVISSKAWREAEQQEINPRYLTPIRVERIGEDVDSLDSETDADDGRELITEHLYLGEYDYLRYSVPFLREGADAVVAKVQPNSHRSEFTGDGRINVYDGDTYLARYVE